ncbi:MAG TPA: pyridoxal-dependent decarboxylase [Candidatus Limnocylindrales bacterium]|nr:pyridoxal-dependent decarboxylase [Candidatus Limnocylindrales bacterium]
MATDDLMADAPKAERNRFDWHPEPELIDVAAPGGREALDAAGRAAWSTALDYLYDEALRRATGAPAGYAELRREFFGPTGRPAAAPARPTASSDLLEEFRTRIAPHQLNAWHPRAFTYFTPPPLVMSILGELLAQVAHQGVDVWHAGPVAAFVEEEVVRWLCDVVGYDGGSFGLLTSGGVMANFIAMALVRDVHLRRLLRASRPPRGAALDGVRVYASDQTHFSIARALDELGFPPETLVVVAADDRFRLHGAPVAEAIARDRAAGLRPVAIAAVAGSTNTGSVDLVEELADVAAREGLWLHVDAAYGGAARLSKRDAWRVPALDRADSVTVDPHKWFFQSYDIGALVVKRGDELAATFDRSPEYYRGGSPVSAEGFADPDGHDAEPGQLNFYKLGFEGTRRWRALKLWLSWRHLGTDGLGRLVEMNDDLAAYLARQCAKSDDFEAIPAEPELSVVCFRHVPAVLRGNTAALDEHQDRLQEALERSGEGWLSTTRLRGATWLRAGILNYMSTEADVDRLLATLRDLAAR